MRFLALAAAAAILLACASPSMTVRADQASYSPAMSSRPGLGLTPVFSAPAGTTCEYHWHASFGTFVSRGADVVAGGETLYWTYDPKLTFAQKPTVRISVEARDRDSGRVLAQEKIVLDWDGDIAHVRE